MRALLKLNDQYGYDPYNHVGCDMRPEIEPLRDKVFVMDPTMLRIFQQDVLDAYKPLGPRFDTLMGAKVITSSIFPTVDA